MGVRLLTLNNHPVHGDDELVSIAARDLAARGICVEIVSRADVGVAAMWDAIQTCTAIVAVRLHAAIPAYLCNVPFVLHEYHRKCSDFLHDVGQQAELRIDSETPVSQIKEAIAAALGGGSQPRLNASDYRARAVQAFRAAPWANGAQ